MRLFSVKQFSLIQPFLIILLFTAVTLAIYSNTFNSPFVLDDVRKIEENSAIRVNRFSPAEIVKAGFQSSRMRPIAFMTLALNHILHKYNVFGYHVINIAIHTITGFLLYLFFLATLKTAPIQHHYGRPDLIAFFAALIWLVHPLQSQSVTYVVQRMNSMAALFYIFAFLLYVKGRLATQPGRKWSWFSSAALAWICALGSKQNAATLPFFIFLYEWYFFQDLSPKWFKSSLKYIIAVAIIFAVVAFLYLGTDPLEKFSKLWDFSQGEFSAKSAIMIFWKITK